MGKIIKITNLICHVIIFSSQCPHMHATSLKIKIICPVGHSWSITENPDNVRGKSQKK
jgi:hypothetical protein